MLNKKDCFSQLSQVVTQGDIYSPPSPNASALLRYANVPVDEHTGIASVILPIDNLSGRQLSVPITLSYHGSGNKVQDISGNVGLGFVLNAGGLITRVMRGLPDESAQGYQYYGKKVYSSNIDSAYLNATMNNKIDGEPDMFYFNFLGHTGKLVFDTLGNAQYLPDQGIRVLRHPIHNSADSVNNRWVLRDFSGTTYEFGVDTGSREITVVNLAGQPITKAITYISSWYLIKVTTPDGKETMNFTYHSGPDLSYMQYRNMTTYVIHHEVTDKRKGLFSSKVIHHEDLSTANVEVTDVSTIIQVLSPKYLSNIKNDMGYVTFGYTSREDLTGGQALNLIQVFNRYDAATPIKTYALNESYFLSPNASDPNAPDSKRLRLDCVTLQGRSAETKQLFKLSYNQQTLLPPRNSDEFDHWGYYTTLDERAGYPSANLTTDKLGNYDDGFDRRVPDSTRMKACILTKVRNVDGGYTNFYYEPNTYIYDGMANFGGGLRIKTIIQNDSLGQVTPIVTQYSYTQDDGTPSGMIYNPKPYYIQGITNYQAGTVVKPIPSLLSYELNNFKKPLTIISTAASVALTIAGVTSPVGLAISVGVTVLVPAVVDAFQFLFHRTHHYHYDSPPFAISSTPLNNLFDINGASVTYGQVQVMKGDGGKTINYYTSQQEYPDSTSAFQLNCLAQPVKTIYGNTGSYPPATSMDFERGLLKQSKSYDSNNNLVSMVTNTFKLSNRSSIVSGQRSSVSGYASLPDGSFQVITYSVGLYNEISENIQLTQSVTQLFDQDHSANALTATHSYTWQPQYPTLVHSESTARSDGKLLVNYVTYPMEYPSGTTFLDDMVRHNMLAVPIERISTLQDLSGIYFTGGVVNRYKTGGLGLLDTVFSLSASNPIAQADFKLSNHAKGIINGTNTAYKVDPRYIATGFYELYDSKDNLIQSRNVGEPSSSIIWGYNQDVPIAQISNATKNKIAYTGFETNDQQYWLFTASGRDSSSSAKTGKIRYQLSSGVVKTLASMPTGTYILSFWTQGAKPTISGPSADVSIVNGESDGHSWNFYMDRVTLSAAAQITLTGTGFIDELRLYPQGAHMSTISVAPQVGTLSVSSQDDKVNTFEYDALQRIKTERDDQYNILKEYSYSNVPAKPCIDTPDVWTGINPVCYTDLTHIVPDTTKYSANATNSYGNIICNFTRTAAETSYLAKINFTVSFTDNTTYSNSILLKTGSLTTLIGLPLMGKSADAVSGIGIDSIINLSDDYGVTYQQYQNRQRVRDGYTETNSLTAGIGPFMAPIQSAAGCALLFTNRAQTNFSKNNCTTGNGSFVQYTVPAGLYNASTQFKADSIARSMGQAYANAHGNCTEADTSWVGTGAHCVTGTADSGTPVLSAYSMVINNTPQLYILSATIRRSSAEATHDATVTYALRFNDGSIATYTTPMYKNQLAINISPPLGGYGPNSLTSTTITTVAYSALKRQAFTNRKRLINGVADGYQEANTTGTYYLAPIENPGACGIWYYSAGQTGFYKNNCPNGTGLPVSYTVPAHTDSSMVSQSIADALARIRGQAYANAHGGCNMVPYVSTIVGTGHSGYLDGDARTAQFTDALYMAKDQAGNTYVVDAFTMIRKISPEGIVSTLAGSLTAGYADGIGTAARFNTIIGIVIDAGGNVFVCDANNNRIRKITPAGVVSTIAGSGVQGHVDGQGTSAELDPTGGLGFDQGGNLYVGDYNYIRKITPGGYVSTYAGNITSGYVDGPIASARFDVIDILIVDGVGNIYIYEQNNKNIRKISSGVVSTLAGNGTYGFHDGTGSAAQFNGIEGMTTDAAGNIYISDYGNSCIRKCTPLGVVTTLNLPPPGNDGYQDGPLSTARFEGPVGILVDANGNIYVDDSNWVVRKITFPH